MFNGHVVIIGYGAVSKCFLPLLLKHLKIPLKKITIIDSQNKSEALNSKYQGLKFYNLQITQHNFNTVLKDITKPGDLLVDLGYSIGLNDVIGWCHENKVLYINTSVEVWDSEETLLKQPIYKKSLHYRHTILEDLTKSWPKNSTTAVIEHGANPGLISSFVKRGLLDIANKLLTISSKDYQNKILNNINNFPLLAQTLGVKVIHCSERDTQITDVPKQVDEFVGTWSIEGFREEATACAELGWGTHELKLPRYAHPPEVGEKNQIFLAKMGINVLIRSWIPCEEIIGMLVRHGEAYTISKYLTVYDKGKPVYRPTVHYAYLPCDSTLASIQEFRGRGYKMQSDIRILAEDICHGKDSLGALIMGHDLGSWWTGTVLDIHKSRELMQEDCHNATTVQVAIGVLAAVKWMIENPNKGVCEPEDLPHDYILKIAEPYLGELISVASDWTPAKNYQRYFKENPDSELRADLWCFENFLLRE